MDQDTNAHRLFLLITQHTPPHMSLAECVNLSVSLDREGVKAP